MQVIKVSVLVFSVFLIAVFIPNIYYYEKIYNDGGTQSIGSQSALAMAVVNIVGLVVAALMSVWMVVLLFNHSEDHRHYGGSHPVPFW